MELSGVRSISLVQLTVKFVGTTTSMKMKRTESEDLMEPVILLVRQNTGRGVNFSIAENCLSPGFGEAADEMPKSTDSEHNSGCSADGSGIPNWIF
jgi:hypothetical protein